MGGYVAELVEKVVGVVEIKPSSDRRTELLDVVKPLCIFVSRLPAYVLNTRKLSPTASAVRDAILNAHEPAPLLFTDLPKACGLAPFAPQAPPGKAVQDTAKTLT